MRILLLALMGKNSGGNIYGGAEKSITNLANWLAENTENEIMLASIEGNAKPFPISTNVKYKGYEFVHKNKVQIHYQVYKNTKEILEEYKPDIVISFWIHPLFYLCLTGKKYKFFYSERNDPRMEYGLVARIMRSFILRRAQGIVFQTREAMVYFSEKIQKKSRVIHNPVYLDTEDYPINPKRNKRIVSVGRLNEQKNYKLLIEAFSRIQDELPGWTLEIYGEGILREQLTDLIISYSLENKVFLKGTYRDILDKIYGAGMFIMTSYYEGMPNALMEAMCLGIPVICSDCPCGGPRELIDNGVNGFLFKNNDIDDLLNAIRKCISNEKIDQMIANEKKICISHSQNQIFKQWYEFFNS